MAPFIPSVIRRIRSDERGSLMLEAIALLGLMTLMSPMLVKQTSEKTQEVEEVTVAGQMKILRDAAMSYIDSNLGMLNDTSATGKFGAGYDATVDGQKMSFLLDNKDLAKFLPPGFCMTEGEGDAEKCYLRNRLVENYRASIVRQHSCDKRDAGGNRIAECKPFDYTVLISSGPKNAGGTVDKIPDKRAMRIAAMIGADGGFIPSTAMDGLIGEDATKKRVVGAQGIWEIPDVSVFFPGTGEGDAAWTPGDGQIAVSTVYKGNATVGEFLYRKGTAVEGGNAMFTDLDLAGAAGLPNDDNGTVSDVALKGTPHDIKGIKGLFMDSEGGLFIRDLARNTTRPGDANFDAYSADVRNSMRPRAQLTANTMMAGSYNSVEEHRFRHNVAMNGIEALGYTELTHGMTADRSDLNRGSGNRFSANVTNVKGVMNTSLVVATGNARDANDNFEGLKFISGRQVDGSASDYAVNSYVTALSGTTTTGISMNSAVDQDLIRAWSSSGAIANSAASVVLPHSPRVDIGAARAYQDAANVRDTAKSEIRLRPEMALTQNSSSRANLVPTADLEIAHYVTNSSNVNAMTNSGYIAGLSAQGYSRDTPEYLTETYSSDYTFRSRPETIQGAPSLSLQSREFSFNGKRDDLTKYTMEESNAHLDMMSSFKSLIPHTRLSSDYIYEQMTGKKAGQQQQISAFADFGPYMGNADGDQNAPRAIMGTVVSDARLGTTGQRDALFSGMDTMIGRSKDLWADTNEQAHGFFGGYNKSTAVGSAFAPSNFPRILGDSYITGQNVVGFEYATNRSMDRGDRGSDVVGYSVAGFGTQRGVAVTNTQISGRSGPTTSFGGRLYWRDDDPWGHHNDPHWTTIYRNGYKSASEAEDTSSVYVKAGKRSSFEDKTLLAMEQPMFGNNAALTGTTAHLMTQKGDTSTTALTMQSLNQNTYIDLASRAEFGRGRDQYMNETDDGRTGVKYTVGQNAVSDMQMDTRNYRAADLNLFYGGMAKSSAYLPAENTEPRAIETASSLSSTYEENATRINAPHKYVWEGGEVYAVPENTNSVRRGAIGNSNWNMGASRLDMSNFSNIVRDEGVLATIEDNSDVTKDSYDFSQTGTYSSVLPQAGLSAISQSETALNSSRARTIMNSADAVTMASQLKLKNYSMSSGNSGKRWSILAPSAQLQAMMVAENAGANFVREGSLLDMRASTANSSINSANVIQTTLTSMRASGTSKEHFRNVDSWEAGRPDTTDYGQGIGYSEARFEKAYLKLNAGNGQKAIGSVSETTLGATTRGGVWAYTGDAFVQAKSDSGFGVSTVTAAATGDWPADGTPMIMLKNKNAAEGVELGMYITPANETKDVEEARGTSIGFFARGRSEPEPSAFFGGLQTVVGRGTDYFSNIPRWNIANGTLSNKSGDFYSMTMESATNSNRRGIAKTMIGGGLLVTENGSPLAEIISMRQDGATTGRLMVRDAAGRSGIDLDPRVMQIYGGYIEIKGRSTSTGSFLSPYMVTATATPEASGCVGVNSSVNSNCWQTIAANSVDLGQTISFTDQNLSGDTKKSTTASMVKYNGSYKTIYNRYRLDPAFVSVMNDIKLTSRGGANLSEILPNYILKETYYMDNTFAKGPWPCEQGQTIENAYSHPSSQKNCTFLIPRGRIATTTTKTKLEKVWETDCVYMNQKGDKNYCYAGKGDTRSNHSLVVNYYDTRYKSCDDTDNKENCLTHPFLGLVAAPGMRVKISNPAADDGEAITLASDDLISEPCPAGYDPYMTVTPLMFDVGKVIFVDMGNPNGGTPGDVGSAPTDLSMVPRYVVPANGETMEELVSGADAWTYEQSRRFVNFGSRRFSDSVPSIYQPATTVAVSAVELRKSTAAACKSATFTSSTVRSDVNAETYPYVCGWAVAMGTVTPSDSSVTGSNYFWNMGGVLRGRMQAVVSTYCVYNPRKFQFPNAYYDTEEKRIKPLDNPNLIYRVNWGRY